MTSFNQLQTFTNRVFAYAMDFKRAKGHMYDLQTPECEEDAQSFLQNTEQETIDVSAYQDDWIRCWQQWLFNTYLYPKLDACLIQKPIYLDELQSISKGYFNIYDPDVKSVGLSVHIAEYHLKPQKKLTPINCIHTLALLELAFLVLNGHLVADLMLPTCTLTSAYLKHYFQLISGGKWRSRHGLWIYQACVSGLVEDYLKTLFWGNLTSQVETFYDELSDRIWDDVEFLDHVILEGIWHVSESGDDEEDEDDDDGDDEADMGDFSSQEGSFQQGQEGQRREQTKEKEEEDRRRFDPEKLFPKETEGNQTRGQIEPIGPKDDAPRAPKDRKSQPYKGLIRARIGTSLGHYSTKKVHIRLNLFNIEQETLRLATTTKHHLSQSLLLEVYLHELSHYFTHQARTKMGNSWDWMDDSIKTIEEGMAQWFTFNVLTNLSSRDSFYQPILDIHHDSMSTSEHYYIHLTWMISYSIDQMLEGFSSYVDEFFKKHDPAHLYYRQHLYDFQALYLNPTKTRSQTFKTSKTEFTMRYCPPILDQKPTEAHRDFWILDTQVTQDLWMSVRTFNPSFFKGGNRPVESMNLFEAMVFCNQLSIYHGLKPVYVYNGKYRELEIDHKSNGYRLPSVDQWIHAAKASSKDKYAGGNCADKIGWLKSNAGGSTHDVKLKKANGWDIYDMGGNVREICVREGHDFRHYFYHDLHLHDLHNLHHYNYHIPFLAKGGAYNSRKRDLLIGSASFFHPLYHETQGFRIVR